MIYAYTSRSRRVPVSRWPSLGRQPGSKRHENHRVPRPRHRRRGPLARDRQGRSALLRQGRVKDADPLEQMWLEGELDDILDELEPMLDRTGHLSDYQDVNRNLRVM